LETAVLLSLLKGMRQVDFDSLLLPKTGFPRLDTVLSRNAGTNN